ncbi:hypothetical protein [Pseudomonas sp. CLCA07]
MSIHQARTALKLRKATEYPVDAKDDSDLRHGWQSTVIKQIPIASKKRLISALVFAL